MSPISIVDELQARRRLPPPAVRRALRESARISQARAARELAVSPALLCRWESGTREVTGEHLPRYLELLDVFAEASP
jgi:transcriptional regulator with XRE-family HTH domain